MPTESDDVWNERFKEAYLRVFEKGREEGARDVLFAVLKQRFAHLDNDRVLIKLAMPVLSCEREKLDEVIAVIATESLAQLWYRLGVDSTWGSPPGENGVTGS